MRKYHVTIVGVSGLVGSTILKVLQEERFPICKLSLFSSEKSKGTIYDFNGKSYYAHTLSDDLPYSDFCLFATNELISKVYVDYAKNRSKYVIDNSSAFRLCENVPLIIPEINFHTISNHTLIANPNCSTAICAIPLWLLNKKYGIKRVRICTYQSVSGSGRSGIDALQGNNYGVYPYDIRNTCIPKIGDFDGFGYSSEELKMRDELRKILAIKDLPVSATCVRVPIKNCHAMVVSVVLKRDFEISSVRKLFASNDAITLSDCPFEDVYPVSTIAVDTNKVYVGRIRRDNAENKALLFYALSDNLRRGAAFNAVKIMQTIISEKMI